MSLISDQVERLRYESNMAYLTDYTSRLLREAADMIEISAEKVNSETPMIRCKDCAYFEYDVVKNVDGIPLIVAHEMCSRWGDGCKTKETGFCFLALAKERED